MYGKDKRVYTKLKECCRELYLLLERYEQQAEILCLKEIQQVVKDLQKDDFEAMEEIVCILGKYGIDFGSRHDFG